MSSPSLPQDAAQLMAWLRDFCFQELGVRKECVTPEADFVRDLGMDSVGFVLLVMELEEQFDIDIPDDVADQSHTVGDAVACLQQLQQSQNTS
jgi:acyl carrier protein